MRKVTAHELRKLGVGHGDPLPLPPGSKLELTKAAICKELEGLLGDDTAVWIRVLKRAKGRITKEPAHTAICELLAELEASSGKKQKVDIKDSVAVKGANQR